MQTTDITCVDGGVTAAQGFVAGAVAAGLKRSKLDVAVLSSDQPATVAGVFTRNKVCAAPVKLCRSVVTSGTAQAIVVNSGNANACTGPRGEADCRRAAEIAAEAMDVAFDDVLICSTGTIGIPLPMDKLESGVRQAAATRTRMGAHDAALAIMTTDLVPKEIAVTVTVDGTPVRVGAMGKGSGMIAPDMATMLAFLTTDAAVEAEALQQCLTDAVARSFNRITVDGDQSTNDTVLFLANGAAGASTLSPAHPDWPAFVAAVTHVTHALAVAMVRDGEGATKFVTVTVAGAASPDDALAAARTVANSLLCKTAWFGGDPNWGRIIAAVGRSGAQVDERTVDIRFDDVAAVIDGVLAPGVSLQDLEAVFARDAFTVCIDLHRGDARDTVYTCDCSYDYVKINSEYMT